MNKIYIYKDINYGLSQQQNILFHLDYHLRTSHTANSKLLVNSTNNINYPIK